MKQLRVKLWHDKDNLDLKKTETLIITRIVLELELESEYPYSTFSTS